MRRSRRLFHGNELFRLISMAGMLVLLGSVLVLNRPADRTSHRSVDSKLNRPANAPAMAELPTEEANESLPTTKEVSVPAVEREAVANRPLDPALTDLDPEQRQAATEEFAAVTDKTTEMQREEMPAYWRVMTWVEQQPLATLKQRAKSQYVLNDLMQEPAVHRGEILRLELNIRRVLSYEVPDNPLGLKRLYEVWGWTSESQAWPYVIVTPELPAGIPTGPDVSGRAVFCGYFFKLQGYLEAGANPRARPLAAPMLVGRLEPRVMPKVPLAGSEAPWIIAAASFLGLAFVARVVWLILRRRRVRSPTPSPVEVRNLPADEWLAGLRRSGPGEASDRPAPGHPKEER